MREYENEEVRWTFCKKVANFFGLGFVSRYTDRKIETVEKTWGTGGRAEVAVGRELERLKKRGFVMLNDLRVRGVGNIDYVAMGPQGIFAIETKSHRGVVSVAGSEMRPVLLLRGTTPNKGFRRAGLARG